MQYCTTTKEKGLVLKPNKRWDGKDPNFLFEITSKSDLDFVKCPITQRSVSKWMTCLNRVLYKHKSKMQCYITLSTTKAECVAATSYIYGMICRKFFFKSLGLKVKLPMILYVDNRGYVDIFNNWSIATNSCAVLI